MSNESPLSKATTKFTENLGSISAILTVSSICTVLTEELLKAQYNSGDILHDYAKLAVFIVSATLSGVVILFLRMKFGRFRYHQRIVYNKLAFLFGTTLESYSRETDIYGYDGIEKYPGIGSTKTTQKFFCRYGRFDKWERFVDLPSSSIDSVSPEEKSINLSTQDKNGGIKELYEIAPPLDPGERVTIVLKREHPAGTWKKKDYLSFSPTRPTRRMSVLLRFHFAAIKTASATVEAGLACEEVTREKEELKLCIKDNEITLNIEYPIPNINYIINFELAKK